MSKQKQQQRIEPVVQDPPIMVQDVPLVEWDDDGPLVPREKSPEERERELSDRVKQLADQLQQAKVEHERHRLDVEASRRPADIDRANWPKDKALPEAYHKQVIPCPKCRRVLTEQGGRASTCTSSGATVAKFRCRCCGHCWKLPVKGS